MPELPEVETMVRDLRPRLSGRRIVEVDAPFAGSISWPTLAVFRKRACGAHILDIRRRGKYALFDLESQDVLAVHRGMTGSLLLRRPSDPMERHVRVILHFDNDRSLRFNDARKFGSLSITKGSGEERTLPWDRLGLEPLGEDFDVERFRNGLKGRKAPIKSLLLRQDVVAGLGNIYVDEALHLARVHPQRQSRTLTRQEVGRLQAAIREVLEAGVEGRGTTFSSYIDIEGRAGTNQHSLRVFRKSGSPCPACATVIQRIVVGGRGTHICRECQRV